MAQCYTADLTQKGRLGTGRRHEQSLYVVEKKVFHDGRDWWFSAKVLLDARRIRF
jgi:hypothetical protein